MMNIILPTPRRIVAVRAEQKKNGKEKSGLECHIYFGMDVRMLMMRSVWIGYWIGVPFENSITKKADEMM